MPLGSLPLINIDNFTTVEIKANANLAMITIRDKRGGLTMIQVRQNLRKLYKKMKSQRYNSQKRDFV